SGALKTYQAIKRQSPGVPHNMLVMGPWSHGGWAGGPGDHLGDARFGSNTGDYYRQNAETTFFNYYLKDKGTVTLPEALVFETGNNRWRQFPAWPPKEAAEKMLYLLPGGKLGFGPPTGGAAYDEYVSDPAKPVPS